MKKRKGRHENPIDDPYKGLAASIILRAIKDIKRQDMKLSRSSHEIKDLQKITEEAETWLKESEWCDMLLDFVGFTISGEEVLYLIRDQMRKAKRRKDYLEKIKDQYNIID